MPRSFIKRLVIDASILRAAGAKDATSARARQCRNCLQAVLDVRHHAVLTPEIRDEWNKHQSRFALAWRTEMAQRGILERSATGPDSSLRRRIENAASSDLNAAAMLKDCRLIEAARQADRTVLSLDDTVRKLFATICGAVRELRPIVWVNPMQPHEQCVAWIAGGARPERQRMLRSYLQEDC